MKIIVFPRTSYKFPYEQDLQLLAHYPKKLIRNQLKAFDDLLRRRTWVADARQAAPKDDMMHDIEQAWLHRWMTRRQHIWNAQLSAYILHPHLCQSNLLYPYLHKFPSFNGFARRSCKVSKHCQGNTPEDDEGSNVSRDGWVSVDKGDASSSRLKKINVENSNYV